MSSIAATVNADLSHLSEMGNGLLAQLNAIREADPIAWNDSVGGWLVNRHEDVTDGFLGKYPLSCVRMETRAFSPEHLQGMRQRFPLTLATLPYWIVNADPPRHTRLRSLMTRAFSKRVVEDLRPFAQATIAKVLDSIEGRDEVEFVEEVARQITGRVILKKFGLDEHYLERLRQWSFSFNAGLGGIVEPGPEAMDRVEQAIAEMQEIFFAEIAKRRAEPTGDFLSELIVARDGSDALSEEELLGICYLAIVAGHDTTLNTMSLGVAALCQDRAARDYLVGHPEAILNSVMEVMRYVAMSTAFNRVAAEDFDWHGKRIRKGERVWLMVAGANRDPRVYENAESIDMTRATDRVMVFGSGIHHCIGHLLGKMQLCEFFPAFFSRFPAAALVSDKLDFQPYFSFRGLNGLRVRLR